MDAVGRQRRLDTARAGVERRAAALAALEDEDRAAAGRLADIDSAATVNRDRLVEVENLRRRRRDLEPERNAAGAALEEARAALVSAERRIGGVVSVRGVPRIGLGPSQAQYLQADGAGGATMHLDRQGVRALVRGDELLLPFPSLTQVVTEEGTHDAAWCVAQADQPAEVAPVAVRDAILFEPFRFGMDRPENRLSRLRGATCSLGTRGLDVKFRGASHVVPYRHVLVAELEPRDPPPGARRAAVVWFKRPSEKLPVYAVERLLLRREPLAAAPPFPGVPFGASGVLSSLDVSRRRGLTMWVSGAGVHVHLDARHWLVPFTVIRFAKLAALQGEPSLR